jgi:pyruvate,water dikinase
MELAFPTWGEEAGELVAAIRSYAALPLERSPDLAIARQEADAAEVARGIEHVMGPFRRTLFARVLTRTRHQVRQREETKATLVRALRLVRRYFPELQRRFIAEGAIASPDDLYFLTPAEVSALLDHGAAPDLPATILRRRRDLERNRHVRLPVRFNGHPVPLPPAAPRDPSEQLVGTPISAGRVTARARVIIDPKDATSLLPGEIIVSPVADTGWTPLFALASGLIVELGSTLSYGSIIARELGLPAVVNVRLATSAIRTGDLVALDATAGLVTIIESV